MTRYIDLSEMTTCKEIKPEYRDSFEEEMEDISFWALEQHTVMEIRKDKKKTHTLCMNDTPFLNYIRFLEEIKTTAESISPN